MLIEICSAITKYMDWWSNWCLYKGAKGSRLFAHRYIEKLGCKTFVHSKTNGCLGNIRECACKQTFHGISSLQIMDLQGPSLGSRL